GRRCPASGRRFNSSERSSAPSSTPSSRKGTRTGTRSPRRTNSTSTTDPRTEASRVFPHDAGAPRVARRSRRSDHLAQLPHSLHRTATERVDVPQGNEDREREDKAEIQHARPEPEEQAHPDQEHHEDRQKS